jgi:ankyrin repeat protein
MHYAAERGSIDALDGLAKAVADLAGHRAPEVLRQLLAAQTLQWRLSPLHVALMHKHAGTARKLIELKANPALRAVGVSADGAGVSYNALHLAVRGAQAGLVSTVLEAAPSLVDSHEWECAHPDAGGREPAGGECGETEGGASAVSPDQDRRLQTALHMAVAQSDRAIILLLIEWIQKLHAPLHFGVGGVVGCGVRMYRVPRPPTDMHP